MAGIVPAVNVHLMVLVVRMVNLIVVMDSAYMVHGNVMAGQTVLMEQTKLTVLPNLVPIKDYGIVVMANVFHQVMFVMDQLIPVMQVGVLTVQMVQMKA